MKNKVKKQDCKHKWHLLEKEIIGGDIIYESTHLGLVPVGNKPIQKILAVFVCEECGNIKRTEIKQKGGKKQKWEH